MPALAPRPHRARPRPTTHPGDPMTDEQATELVHYASADGIGTITLDSPRNRNALSRRLVTGLFDALDRAEEDAEARVVVIRSSERVFCSGADLTEASAHGMEEGTRAL